MQALKKLRGNGEVEGKEAVKNFKIFVSSNIGSPGSLSFKREE